MLYGSAVPVLVSTADILKGAYRACADKRKFWLMKLPISQVYLSLVLVFSSTNADHCFFYEFWSIMLVFPILTIKIIICSVSKVP